MNLLQLQLGSKQYGPKILFQEASLSIDSNEHIGVIGPNGAGKTTLFKIFVGQEELDSGTLVKAHGLRIGYLEQESEWSLDQSSEEYLKENCLKPIWALKRIGIDLGLKDEHFQVPLRSLSGGYRMRMKLLYLIGQEPHLMLLDEPTNFLDLESILSLEKFLRDYTGAFLLTSHDREFLRRVTESTVEVESGDIVKFPGHIDDYFEQKAQLKEILLAQAANLMARRKEIQNFIDRFRSKATKARQAQSRIKQLEKMEKVELKALPVRSVIKIPPPVHTGKEVLKIEDAHFGYGTKTVMKNVHLRLERGDHLGVVGFNGVGKSTLLKSLAGRIPLLSGSCQYGYQVSLSYFAQHIAEELNLKSTVVECLEMKAHSDVSRQEILNMAGSLLFSGEDVYKKVEVLSGGEKARVALGQILLQKSPLIIMDEPTNHLDFDTVEALTEALRSYEGSLIVVSHDRHFIRKVSNKILEIKDGHAEIYPGNYDDYLWSLEKGALKARIDENLNSHSSLQSKSVVEASISDGAPLKVNYKEKSKSLQNQIRDLEKKIKKNELELEKKSLLREEKNKAILSAQGPEVQLLIKELALLSEEISDIENEILEFMESLEETEQELIKLKNLN